MRGARLLLAAPVALVCQPAIAGEEVLYGPAPDWVSVYDSDDLDRKDKSPLPLLDVQQRIEGDVLTVYVDTARKLESPENLTMAGTSSAVWYPERGDITVHAVQILRGNETIDVLAGGSRYTVLRRETELERRQLSGALTATLAIPGLQVGDILRIAYSQTTSDDALMGEVQHTTQLLAGSLEVQFGRNELSWPKDLPVAWKAAPDVDAVEERDEGGFHYVTIELPLDERDEFPDDAPKRYTRPATLQATTFDGWLDVSRVFAPVYDADGLIEPGGPIAREVDRIMAETADPTRRAAMATRIVQDRIGYLANGMAGGNYVPQRPAETWTKRFGDCKAVTLLLLSMLKAMDIEAEAVLVHSTAGDAVQDMLPMPGAFDHVVVRARIGDTDYWLDGTANGTRLENLANSPSFAFGLPIRAEGGELMPIEPRVPAAADYKADVIFDQSAGITLPTLVTADMGFGGQQASSVGAILAQANEEQIDAFIQAFAGEMFDGIVISSGKVSYDKEAAFASLSFTGLITSPWDVESGSMRQSFGNLITANLSFSPDRSRPAWRDIPVALGAPVLFEQQFEVILPPDRDGFVLRGRPDIDVQYAATRAERSSSFDGNRLIVTERLANEGGELSADRIAAERGKVARIAAATPFLIAPKNLPAPMDYAKPEFRKLVAPLEDAYASAIKRNPKSASILHGRAGFRLTVADLEGALEDIDKAIEIEVDAGSYDTRAWIHIYRGNQDEALADRRLAFEQEPSASTAMALAGQLGRMGETEEALSLIEDFDDYGENHEAFRETYAEILAYAGRQEEGLDTIEALVADNPSDASLLNTSCWYKARFRVGMDTMIETCDRAVEQASSAASALDSRALAWYQLGEFEKSLSDAERALELWPGGRAPSMVRAFAQRSLGDAQGKQQVAYLAKAWPGLVDEYAFYGLKP